ncbi:MAG: TonB-dependent receptor plug domain-containing protein, partial [Tannerella sp.]|nr:TonB-dependent receptor plug domain-containing protein [Tannerella sp.]
MQSPQNVVQIGESLLKKNFSGSLMQSLEKNPGIKAMSIGSGQSKPAIRGLGFNRMLVAENGIKHEGQQWGEDHGLEIDQFALDNIEIVKGPGALFYGSDAIAGVINLKSSYIPQETLEGKINLFGRTNNESAGVSAHLGSKKNGFWWKANFTLIDYADYQVPADSIQYYSYYIKLKDRKLRNTAGKERNGGVHIGFISDRLLTTFYLSDVYAKSGFFADAHGLEVRLSEIDYDKSVRDMDLPYHSVNHIKVTNHTSYRFDGLTL